MTVIFDRNLNGCLVDELILRIDKPQVVIILNWNLRGQFVTDQNPRGSLCILAQKEKEKEKEKDIGWNIKESCQ